LLTVIGPGYEESLPQLKTGAGLEALLEYSSPRAAAINGERAASVRRLAQRLQLAITQAVTLGKRIREIAAAHFQPFTESAASAYSRLGRSPASWELDGASPRMPNSRPTPAWRPWKHRQQAR
jgi:hypothetical protein